jgi:sec-independent protein translocase protein TatB
VFDVSFFELLVIGVVALVVIGPERLPGAVKSCALWLGRLKRSMLDAREEIEKHIGADDIRRELHNEQVLHNMEKMKEVHRELEERIRSLDAPVSSSFNALDSAPPEQTDTSNTIASSHSDTVVSQNAEIQRAALEKSTPDAESSTHLPPKL